MYYQEKIINGVLCFRTSPNASFKEYSIEYLSQRVLDLQLEVSQLNNKIYEMTEILNPKDNY